MAKLRYPIEFEGKRIEEITLRRATVKDMRKAKEISGDDAESEILLISNLANLPIDAIEALDLWDYQVLQKELSSFLPKSRRSQN